VDVSGSLTAQGVHTTVTAELFRAAANGWVADPAAEGFAAWPRERRRALWPSVDSGYLYSRHQLLGLDVAAPPTLAQRGDGTRVVRRGTYRPATPHAVRYPPSFGPRSAASRPSSATTTSSRHSTLTTSQEANPGNRAGRQGHVTARSSPRKESRMKRVRVLAAALFAGLRHLPQTMPKAVWQAIAAASFLFRCSAH
jgi:hypothetical protein